MYFESHAHYDDSRYKKDRDELLKSLPENDIDYVINVGACVKSSKRSIELSKKYDYIYTAVGVHPHNVANLTENDMKILEDYAKDKKVVAIGEIGLDYYYEHSPKDKQLYWFKKQLELANKLNLPVIIHSRDADQESFNIIKESPARKGVIHCFSGSKELALEYVKLGFSIGMGGVITFPNARKSVEAVAALPLENLLLETDCPYLSPSPNRGKRNDSLNLKYISSKIAEIKNVKSEDIAIATYKNAVEMFLKK